MKILKNKKCLASIAAILVALALVAGSTMAWFVLRGDLGIDTIDVGYLDLEFENVFGDYIFDTTDPNYKPAEPGELIGFSFLINSDNTLKDDPADYVEEILDSQWGTPTGIFTSIEDFAWGKIWNRGNLSIVIQLNADTAVTRKYRDPDPNAFPSVAFRPGSAAADVSKQLVTLNPANPADVPYINGVPGAVITKLVIPPTQNNVDVFTDANVVLYQSDVTGYYYLVIDPGFCVDVAVIVDLKTNASTTVLTGPTPRKYLDNTYMECQIDAGFNYVATQGMQTGAWADIFGEWQYDGTSGDIKYAYTEWLTITGFNPFNPSVPNPGGFVVIDLN